MKKILIVLLVLLFIQNCKSTSDIQQSETAKTIEISSEKMNFNSPINLGSSQEYFTYKFKYKDKIASIITPVYEKDIPFNGSFTTYTLDSANVNFENNKVDLFFNMPNGKQRLYKLRINFDKNKIEESTYFSLGLFNDAEVCYYSIDKDLNTPYRIIENYSNCYSIHYWIPKYKGSLIGSSMNEDYGKLIMVDSSKFYQVKNSYDLIFPIESVINDGYPVLNLKDKDSIIRINNFNKSVIVDRNYLR